MIIISFFGHKTEHILLTSHLARCLQCFHILSLTVKACEISLDLKPFAHEAHVRPDPLPMEFVAIMSTHNDSYRVLLPL